MKFSQRIGKTPVRETLQVESIDQDLRNRLWNVILQDFFSNIDPYATSNKLSQQDKVAIIVWKEFFKNPIDEIPSYQGEGVYFSGFITYLRKWYMQAWWYQVYDLVEFLAELDMGRLRTGFVDICNSALEKEAAGYRIISGNVVQITSEEEVNEIEEAITQVSWKSVNTHLQTALEYLADRNNPDFRNSIKESISAVESLCAIITGDSSTTLGKALSAIEKKYKLHNALKSAFSSLYGYTSDSGGIRHSLLEDDIAVTFEDAKFMLVSCSAFINYLRAKVGN